MKRVNAFDIIRGFAVVFLIILHTGLHHWTGALAIEGGSQESDPMMNVLVFFLTLGGIFYAIMGAVNSYMFTLRLEEKRNTVKQIQLNSCLLGFAFILLHYFFRFVVSGDSGILFHLIGSRTFILPSAEWLISSSTLPMLGYNSIIIGLILPKLIENKMKGTITAQKNYLILGGIGLFVVLLALPIRIGLAPLVQTWIESKHYLPALLLAPFVYDNFPIFPMVGFGFFGSIFGLQLAQKEPPQRIFMYLGLQAVLWMTVGLIGIRLRGGIHPDIIPLHTIDGIFEDFFRHCGQIGICFIFFIAAYTVFDFLPSKFNFPIMKYFEWLRSFSMISLTVYVFEALITVTIRELINLIPGIQGWNDYLGNVVLFGFGMALIWGIVSYFWAKKQYKGSLEWILLYIAGKVSGKHTNKYNHLKNEG